MRVRVPGGVWHPGGVTVEAIRSGIDLSHVDSDARPQDDLFGHVNGRWLAEYEMPADRATDGAFRSLYDRAEEQVRDLITEAAASGAATGTDEQRIGDLYASFMDEQTVAERGVQPLLDELADRRRRRSTPRRWPRCWGRCSAPASAAATGVYVDTDSKDSTRYLVHLNQSGLGLPDESYYRDEQHAEILAAYPEHIAAMFALVYGRATTPRRRHAIVALETKLAAAHWDVVKRRDADLTYNLRTFADLPAEAPGFDWTGWITALGATPESVAELVVRQPDYLTAFAAAWSGEDLEDWKSLASVEADSCPRVPADRRPGGRGFRVLRPQALGHRGDPRPLEARCVGGREPDGRRRRQAVRRAAFPAAGQGADGRIGGQPAGGLPGQHQRPGVDDAADAGARRSPSWTSSRPRSATRRSGGTIRSWSSSATTCTATTGAATPSATTVNWPSSAARSTATSGS